MRPTGVGMRLGLGLGALLGTPACESQVGEAYEGEVQFSLEGTVHGAESGWRPRLAFVTEREMLFVDGIVTGSFPAKFRFDVTEAPPAEVLAAARLDPLHKGKVALAYIVMMPEDAPDKVPFLEITRSELCEGDDCVWSETACSPAGSCRKRTLECETCEVIGEVGDPAVKGAGGGFATTTVIVGSNAIGITTSCESETNCHRKYTECEVTSLLALKTGPDGLQHCTILEESGDTSLVDPSEFQSTAHGFVVAYATEQTATPVGTLGKGYHLLQLPSVTREEALAAPLECETYMDHLFCLPVFMPDVVDGADVSIDLGLPLPM